MSLDKEMQKALEADGEKLRALTGEDHGPVFVHHGFRERCGEEDIDPSIEAFELSGEVVCSDCASEIFEALGELEGELP